MPHLMRETARRPSIGLPHRGNPGNNRAMTPGNFA